MVFNIAAGALNIRDSGKIPSFESYCLAITELALVVFSLTMILLGSTSMMLLIGKILKDGGDISWEITTNIPIFKQNKIMQMIFTTLIVAGYFAVPAANIAYSTLVIQYYSDKKVIDKQLYDFSIGIITVNSLNLVKDIVKYIKRR